MGNQVSLSELPPMYINHDEREAVTSLCARYGGYGGYTGWELAYRRECQLLEALAQLRAANERAERAEKERDVYKSANMCNAATVDLLASQKIQLKAEISHLRAEADKAKPAAVPDAEGAD